MVPALQREGPGDGRCARKSRAAKAGDWLENTRKAWEQTANQALERAGREERIDGRSLAERRDEAYRSGDLARAAELSREPNVHLGPSRHREGSGAAAQEKLQKAERVEQGNRADAAERDAHSRRWRGSRGRFAGLRCG